MKFYSENISPDSLSGAIFSIEGIRDACVVLNGPTGCKFYHSAISDSQFHHSLGFDAGVYSEGFYLGQSRVPSTYLDSQDYIFGAGEKLERILRDAGRRGCKLIAVINSPGAALIGDDLEGILRREVRGVPCFALENSGFSGTFGAGYQRALMKVIDALSLSPRKRGLHEDLRTDGRQMNSSKFMTDGHRMNGGNKVNLLGFCIYQKHYDGSIRALKNLLERCGIEVVSTPGALDSLEAVARLPEADLNVAVYPEYARELGEKLEAELGIPLLCLREGPPLGFDAAAAFVREICAALDRESAAALEAIARARGRAYYYLARFSSLLGLPKGALFSIRAEASTAYALTRWLCGYLGMIPAAISVLPGADGPSLKKLEDFLEGIHYREVLDQPVLERETHLLFADGNTIAALKLAGKTFCGIEIALPSLGYLDITGKALLGETGALFLLEQIMNGLRYVLT
ncbi:MAG: nitrogenase component 1 [Spirochaetaceae bacterium]|jgi:nitrogenase molybdenum-iron protein alpha/beta subunit|nr:nitrogenase component 1 [Spirochaetaceae bacterium]